MKIKIIGQWCAAAWMLVASVTLSAEQLPIVWTNDLYVAYSQNGIAADQRYRTQSFLLIGGIKHINRNAAGVPFIVLSAIPGMDVIARYPSVMTSELAGLRPHVYIASKCIGAGVSHGFPVVDCTTIQDPPDQNKTNEPARTNPPARVSGIISEFENRDGTCKAGGGNDPQTIAACEDADKLMATIKKSGWCWGPLASNSYRRTWVECKSAN